MFSSGFSGLAQRAVRRAGESALKRARAFPCAPDTAESGRMAGRPSSSASDVESRLRGIPKLEGRQVVEGRVVGTGREAIVCRGELALEDGTRAEVAVKSPYSNYVRYSIHEAQILNQLRDLKGVPRLHGVVLKPFALVLELCEGPTVGAALREGRNVHMLEGFAQICEAVQSMHNRRITHRDLHYDNMFLNARGLDVEAKVVDFGLAEEWREDELVQHLREDNFRLSSLASKFVPFLRAGHEATDEFIQMLQDYPPPTAECLAIASRKARVNPEQIRHKYKPPNPGFIESW